MPVVVDSVTRLDSSARGRVVVCGSHGGVYAAAFAASCGVRGIVFNDACIGRDGAGVGGLELLERRGVPAVTVAGASATIGDGQDTLERGVVSHANGPAAALGCRAGLPAREAAELLAAAPEPAAGDALDVEESRHLVREGPPAVWALDSVSLARADDADALLLTGSHANLLGGRPETALKSDARLAVYNDAGVDAATGLTRLPALDARGIPAAAVDVWSARIGDGRSTYEDGVVTAVNETARALGAAPRMTARELVDLVAGA